MVSTTVTKRIRKYLKHVSTLQPNCRSDNAKNTQLLQTQKKLHEEEGVKITNNRNRERNCAREVHQDHHPSRTSTHTQRRKPSQFAHDPTNPTTNPVEECDPTAVMSDRQNSGGGGG